MFPTENGYSQINPNVPNTSPDVYQNNLNNNEGHKTTFLGSIIILLLIIVGVGCYFYYNKILIPKREAALIEQQKQDLYKKILESKEGELVSLTEQEYDVLFARPLNNVEVKGVISTTTTNIKAGFQGGDVEIAFPYVPNLNIGFESGAYAVFDSIIDNQGKELMDKDSGFEKKGMFTDLDLTKKISGDVPYWLGSRYVTLTDYSNRDNISYVSGKLIVDLRVDITSIELGFDDLGLEKPFADGFVILQKIESDSISYKLPGSFSDFMKLEIIDNQGNVKSLTSYSCSSGYCTSGVENFSKLKIYNSKKITKEFPFTIGSKDAIGTQINSTSSTDAQDDTSVAVENKEQNNTVALSKTPSSTSLSAGEIDAIAKAYFDFEKVLDTKDPLKLLDYMKKVYPSSVAKIEKDYQNDKTGQKDFLESIDVIKSFLGYDENRTLEQFKSTSGEWEKISNTEVKVDMFMVFRKVNGVWYVHINQNY